MSLGYLVDKTVDNLERHTHRDDEFERQFGRFSRPDGMPRYDLLRRARLISWSSDQEGIIEAAPFIRSLLECDRPVAGQIARFTAEEFEGEPASDTILNRFRNHYFRRLVMVGY